MRVFLFNRSLRLQDNTSLLRMTSENKEDPLVCLFIFTPEQIEPSQNKYYCGNAVAFMIEALKEINSQLKSYKHKLYIMYGGTIECLEKVNEKEKISEIGINRDYTPYARKREKLIETFCQRIDAGFTAEEDTLLYAIAQSQKGDGTPYKVFTPYKNHLESLPPVRKPNMRELNLKPLPRALKGSLQNLETDWKEIRPTNDTPHRIHRGTRKAGLVRLKKDHSNYSTTRDILAGRTTLLSPYLSFGILSVREVYWHIVEKYGKKFSLVTELMWREFYTSILYYFPYVLHRNFKPSFDGMLWNTDSRALKKWKEGKTGFPVVDAGMRQLVIEGFMANRARMIVSSFLVKHLLINWRHGERFFAQHLTDVYLPTNLSSWNWCFGGADPTWFRVFNPQTQGSKFDKDCRYIKKYIPELRDVPSKHIHQWTEYHKEYDVYEPPCVDLKERRAEFLERARSLT